MKSLTLSTDISFGYPNCCLRRLRFQDTPFIKQWRNSQMAILRQTKELTDEDQVNWFKQIQTDTGQSLFALTNQEDSLIGYAGLTNIDWVNHRAEISFLLLTGIHQATYRLVFLDALAALQVHAFEQLGLHKIFAETFEFRTFHLSVLEEFGFEPTGRLVDHIYHDGNYVDSVIHSILNPTHHE